MNSPLFIHLRVHSAYSLAQGALKIEQLIDLCHEKDMPAVAVTDSGNLFGALEFALAAAKGGVQPIIGCELQVLNERSGGNPTFDTLVLLVQSETGYKNLLRLVTKSFLELHDPHPHVTLSDIAVHNQGLIALTAGLEGSVGKLLLAGQKDHAKSELQNLFGLFGDRLYIEIGRHGLAEEATIEPDFLALGYDLGIPFVATNTCFFDTQSMYQAHEVLLCVADGAVLLDPNHPHKTPEHYFKSTQEMVTLFADLPEAITNTIQIAKRCHYMPREVNPILPVFDVDGLPEPVALKTLAEEGLKARLLAKGPLENEKVYWDRLAYELGVITSMGFSGYFLIVADFIRWAKNQDIPVGPGRGSGAGSVIAWALTITDLDPIYFGLLFERFLNPDRVSMPDFDIDFCQDRRDEVIAYVQQKHGKDRVAQIITFGKLQARAVLRDVGRVLSMPYSQVDRLCKFVPNDPANPVTLEQAIDTEPNLQLMADEDEMVAQLLEIGQKLEGLYRHASTHAAGVVIGDRDLVELIPLYKDTKSELAATQFSMKYVEKAGLVKFDFLGLKTLTVMQKAVEFIAGNGGPSLNLSLLPLDDTKTFEMLQRCESVGIFQVESAGMRDVMRKMVPTRFEELIALVALYRPGPMENIPKYLACKHGEEEIDYLHPMIEHILKETYGIMIYQEQVMQVAQVLANYTLAQADLLRRAMGKKIKSEMQEQQELFVAGAKANGVDEATAVRIFEQMEKFAGYGFNKSHAACYAMVLYQTAYLKAHFPEEFLAATMSYDLNNTDKLNVFRLELLRMGIPVLPPSVNAGEVDFAVETDPVSGKKAVRYSLAALKNVGAAAVELLVKERKAHGPFMSIVDFISRLEQRAINKRSLETMIGAGALDELDSDRAKLYESIEELTRHTGSRDAAKNTDQASLFASSVVSLPVLRFAKPKPWSMMEKLGKEFDALGFFLSGHPLEQYTPLLSKLKVLPSDQIATTKQSLFKVAGVVVSHKIRKSAKGNSFAFLQLSDAFGGYEVTLFSEVLNQAREWLEAGTPLLLSVEKRVDGEQVRLTTQRIELLEENTTQKEKVVCVTLSSPSSLERLQSILVNLPYGQTVLKVELLTEKARVELTLPNRYQLKAGILAELQTL